MENRRDLFRRFLEDDPMPRPAFVPMVRGLLSRVEGIPMETLMSDPTLWANSLMKTDKLFHFDGIIVGLDFTLMAEACGCEISWTDDRPVASRPQKGLCERPEETGRMRHALEAARRVFEVNRKSMACVAAMTGPVTLASMLFGAEEAEARLKDVKQMAVQVAEAFCRSGPDVLIFMERSPLASKKVSMAHRKIYNTLKNVLGYYDVKAGLYVQGYDPMNVDDFRALKLDLYVLGPSKDGALPPVPRVWDLGVGALGIGLGLPLNDLEKAKELIKEGRELYRKSGGRGIFFTSLGPTTRDVDLEVLHELVNEIFQL